MSYVHIIQIATLKRCMLDTLVSSLDDLLESSRFRVQCECLPLPGHQLTWLVVHLRAAVAQGHYRGNQGCMHSRGEIVHTVEGRLYTQ